MKSPLLFLGFLEGMNYDVVPALDGHEHDVPCVVVIRSRSKTDKSGVLAKARSISSGRFLALSSSFSREVVFLDCFGGCFNEARVSCDIAIINASCHVTGKDMVLLDRNGRVGGFGGRRKRGVAKVCKCDLSLDVSLVTKCEPMPPNRFDVDRPLVLGDEDVVVLATQSLERLQRSVPEYLYLVVAVH